LEGAKTRSSLNKKIPVMQYLPVLLMLLACNVAEKKSPETPAATSVSSTTVAAADTLVPAKFENGKLVRVEKSDAEWKKQLTEMEYYVLRQEGTERAFTGDLWNNHDKGTFICAACGLPLFASDTKFESGTGWPSFYQPLSKEYVREISDNSYGMTRTEVECARCGGHLGHVFDDGPRPTGLRYCMNSASLDLVKQL
jgi:peptide-methionine (R)-S-oxide reductase